MIEVLVFINLLMIMIMLIIIDLKLNNILTNGLTIKSTVMSDEQYKNFIQDLVSKTLEQFEEEEQINIEHNLN